jgi:hypothetical protein
MSVFLSLLAFYTKAYFVLSFGIVAGYLLLSVSLKKSFFYSFLFLSFFVTSLYLVRLIFPLYFINTIIGNISNTIRSTEHLLSQFRQLTFFFYPVLIVTIVILIMELRKKDVLLKPENKKFSVNYYLFAFTSALLAFTLILGLHVGSYLNYAYQMLIPTFFCWFFQIANFSKGKRWSLAFIVVVNLLMWQYTLLNPNMLKQKKSKEWAQVENYLQTSLNILNAPVVTSAVVELGLNPLDSGQTIYFYSVQPYADNILIGTPYEAFNADGVMYVNNIDRSIERKSYDLVATIKEKASFYSMQLLNENYSITDEIIVDMPQTNQHWTVLIWRPVGE